MKSGLMALACTMLLACASSPPPENENVEVLDRKAWESALDNPARSDKDRQRDKRDRVAEQLALLPLQPGMVVADVFAGGGYYSEILAQAMGPDSTVLLLNNPPYARYARGELERRDFAQRLPQVNVKVVDNSDLQMPPGGLDAALLIMTFHDIFYAEPETGWTQIDEEQFLEQIFRALKPGGYLLLSDHAAVDGRAASDAKSLHRIEESYVEERLEQAGFVLSKRWSGQHNREDNRQGSVFDPAIRGRTDRFVHVYQKPKAPAKRFYYE